MKPFRMATVNREGEDKVNLECEGRLHTRILTADDAKHIAEAARIIRAGGLVAFPTETVYGLGANALDERAVIGIFQAKERPLFDPLIVHCASRREVERLVRSFPPRARMLAERFWPGPLTLVLPRKDVVPDIVTAGLPTVAVRIPAHPVARTLIELAGCPLAAPSANRFGRISPTRADHVRTDLEGRIDLIIDGGQTRIGVESTVVLADGDHLYLLRPGGVSREALDQAAGPVLDRRERGEVLSPGTLKRHYAPRVPLYLFEGDSSYLSPAEFEGETVITLTPRRIAGRPTIALSRSGDLVEAASNLFRTLRELESQPVNRVIVIPFEERGLGLAIMDRLRRASSGRVQSRNNELFFIDRKPSE